MKAIVGLGNPGAEYDATRHNVGFEVVDELARRWAVKLKPWRKVALLGDAKSRAVLLAEPMTFMNLSGECVQKICAYRRIEPSDLLVVVDDVNLPLGRLRLRRTGSAGGHNGLKSIIQHVGPDFARLRLGVGRGDPKWDLADHVLSRFGRDERKAAAEAVGRAADAAEMFAAESIELVMNRFNASDDRVTE
jgi:peptidyl-tRNA hydrolase, PTH1 family